MSAAPAYGVLLELLRARTKEFQGWKVSPVNQPENRVGKRRAHLLAVHDELEGNAKRLPESGRHRQWQVERDAAIDSQARRRLRRKLQ